MKLQKQLTFLEKIKSNHYLKKFIKKHPNQNYVSWDDAKYIIKNPHLTYKDLYKSENRVDNLKIELSSNVMYQVLVYNFVDGNKDGIGDFYGLINKIDYFVNLGIDQIWLSPIHPSSGYHGYSVIDYCDVAPQLGGMKAFKEFLKLAHKKGIKIYLDLVFNHTSYEHPWFQEALKGNKKYENFYNFHPKSDDKDARIDLQKIRSIYKNIDQSFKATNKKFLARFWAGMPDLNLNNKEVIEELCSIQKFWTKIGVDGFRYDAFSEYFSSESEEKNNFTESKIFNELRIASNEITKESNQNDVFMIGEWLTEGLKAFEYFEYNGQKALDTIYDGWKHFRDNDDVRLSYNELISIIERYENTKFKNEWVPFLDNHDTTRWLDYYRLNVKKIKNYSKITTDEMDAIRCALFYLLSLPAKPIIYYGDELSYAGTRDYGDPGLREPLKWSNKNEIAAIFETKADAVQSHLFLNVSNSLLYVEDIIKDDKSIYKMVALINSLRKKYPFLSSTNSKTLYDPWLVVDSEEYSNIIVRKDINNENEMFVFVIFTHKTQLKPIQKISRNFHFKTIYEYNVKNEPWGIVPLGYGCGLYKITRK
ncbi:alpha-amylase family glycosyl hydrolase [Mycoplasma elephantis]|uniref:alpha-amylase family glycosyl hydrolase n=1 Tax=Mycoplasma elephantis TaxID=114882 RepID=UPI00068BFFC1|nr:alpha-amylase family glycosyl hydrolase [Mycoplasma elephantis]